MVYRLNSCFIRYYILKSYDLNHVGLWGWQKGPTHPVNNPSKKGRSKADQLEM
jgi:hypothetical protein